jgi:two-component system, NtrC family, response regulator GlrR
MARRRSAPASRGVRNAAVRVPNGPAMETQVEAHESTRERQQKRETLEIVATRRRGGWMLEIQDDAGGRRVPVSASGLVIGSGGDADVRVHDPTVSARHCAVRMHGGALVVHDLGSRNGTFVGGARVKEAWTAEGTTITVGQSTIVCAARQEGDAHDDHDDEGEPLGPPLPGVAGASTEMRRVAAVVRRLAKLGAPVLVSGETGVGKELVARALHCEGPRKDAPFVAMNVAARPRELVESELFGHERGAFTGAVSRRVGAFAEAEGGTLFLDEIGELPFDAQPKLLRALDGYEVRRIGSAGSGRRANARVIAATHVPLLEQVGRGLFRRDLYHRLEVFVVELPPLRARPGDILPIARAMLLEMEGDIGRRELTPAAIAQLAIHDWPGNVRELRNVLYRAADLTEGRRFIDAAAVQRALRKTRQRTLSFTPELAKEWLEQHGGNVSAAARAAGVPRTSFRKLLYGG